MTGDRYTFAALEPLPLDHLEAIRDRMAKSLQAEKEKRWQLIGQILYYQDAIILERANGAAALHARAKAAGIDVGDLAH